MTAEEALRELFAERRRREHPPSTAGRRPEERGARVDDGRYEDLLLLTVGCDPMALEAMYVASGAYTLGDPCECGQVVEHVHRVARGLDGSLLPHTVAVTTSVSGAQILMLLGVPDREARSRVASVLSLVSERLGERRGAARAEDEAERAWRLRQVRRD